jgi:hypothetical protein
MAPEKRGDWLDAVNGGKRSYQIACHVLARYKIELAYAKHHA